MKTTAFRYLWVGKSLANLGDVLYILALIVTVHRVSGSIFHTTMVPFCIMIFRLFGTAATSVMLDRNKLMNLLTQIQFGKIVLLVAMSITVLSHSLLWIIFLIASFIAFIDGFISPSANIFFPFIINREEPLQTTGFLSTFNQSIIAVGWLIGSVITANFYPVTTLFISVFCYSVSTFLTYSIPKNNETISVEKHTIHTYVQRIMKGWNCIYQNHQLRYIHLSYGIEAVANSVWLAAVLLVYVDKLGIGEQWWGLLNSAYIVGILIASVLLIKFHSRFSSHQKNLLFICSVFTAIITVVFSKNDLPILVIIFTGLIGLFNQLKGIIFMTCLQQNIDPKGIPGVYAFQNTVFPLIIVFSVLLVGFLMLNFSVQIIFLLSGVLMFINSAFIFTAFREK